MTLTADAETTVPEITRVTVTLPATELVRAIVSVMPCAGRDVTMPAINAVHIEWGATEIVCAATDRTVLGEHTVTLLESQCDPARESGAVSVPLDTLKSFLAVVKATRPDAVTLELEGHEYRGQVEWARGTIQGIPFGAPGAFPKYRTLFPHRDSFGPIGSMIVDPARIAQLAGPKVRGKFSPLRFDFTPSENFPKPVTVTRLGDEEYRAIVMPIRPA